MDADDNKVRAEMLDTLDQRGKVPSLWMPTTTRSAPRCWTCSTPQTRLEKTSLHRARGRALKILEAEMLVTVMDFKAGAELACSAGF